DFNEKLRTAGGLNDSQRASIGAFHAASGAADWDGFIAKLGTYRNFPLAQRLDTYRMAMGQLHAQYAYNQSDEKKVDAGAEPGQVFAAFKHNASIGYYGQGGF